MPNLHHPHSLKMFHVSKSGRLPRPPVQLAVAATRHGFHSLYHPVSRTTALTSLSNVAGFSFSQGLFSYFDSENNLKLGKKSR